MSPQPTSTDEPVFSEFEDDPDFREILVPFVDSLQSLGQQFVELNTQEDWPELSRLAHQMKGAGGGYGFRGLSERARDLEYAARDQNQPAILQHLNDVLRYIERIQVS